VRRRRAGIGEPERRADKVLGFLDRLEKGGGGVKKSWGKDKCPS